METNAWRRPQLVYHKSGNVSNAGVFLENAAKHLEPVQDRNFRIMTENCERIRDSSEIVGLRPGERFRRSGLVKIRL